MLVVKLMVSLEVVYQEVSVINKLFHLQSCLINYLAGGYDAIYLLAINDNLNDKNSIPKSFNKIQDLWINWTELSVSPLLCTEGFEGIKVESEEEFEKFINNG